MDGHFDWIFFFKKPIDFSFKIARFLDFSLLC